MSQETSPLLESPKRVPRDYRLVVYIISLIGCLLGASFTVFSLYSVSFAKELGYSPVQINIIAITAEIGLYVPVPLLGHLADSYRLSYLGVGGGIGYLLAYLGAGMVYANQGSYILMALCFVLLGIATSAVFICLLVNCGRLYPKSAFLAISAPVTAYGLSSLLFSKWVSALAEQGVPLNHTFNTLAVILFAVGVATFLGPILTNTDVIDHSPHTGTIDDEEEQADFGHPPVSHIARFIQNPETWLLLATFVLVSGPLEVYLNNLGTIFEGVVPKPDPAVQVSVFSIFSTVSRLLVGAAADLFSTSLRPSRVLVLVLVVLFGTHLLLAQHKFGEIPFAISSAVNGFAYGTAFTLYPILVTRVWGLDGFATYWGMFISGPALGSLLFGVVLALDFDRYGDFGIMFGLSSLGLLVSIVIIHRLTSTWGKERELALDWNTLEL